jgi:type IV secretion system protein TrbF
MSTEPNPLANVGTNTVAVQVTSVVRASDRSFQVKWREQVFERGALASTLEWTAILTIIIQPPKSADVLRKNPLGLYVDAIAWSRELETIAVPQEAATEPVPVTSDAAPLTPDAALSEQTERTKP